MLFNETLIVKRKEKGLFSIKAIVLCVAISAMLMMSLPVLAGTTYTYYHGNNSSSKKALARTVASSPVDSMSIKLNITFDDGTSYTKNGSSADSNICYVESNSLKNKSGYSYAYYYVNGTLRHTSTASYRFSY